MSLAIRSIGTAVPPQRIAQEEAAAVARSTCVASPLEAALVTRFHQNSGVRVRHSVVLEPGDAPRTSFYPPARNAQDRGPSTAERMRRYESEAGRLAVEAASAALRSAEAIPREFTHLVTVSCTGFHSPGFDLALVRELGLSASIARTHVGFMGCHAALNGLRVAQGYIGSQPTARVLLVAVELCSLHYQYGAEAQQVVANALFADGAAAMVATGSPTNVDAWRLVAQNSLVVPHTEELMRWLVRDHGFEMTLSPQVPRVILAKLRNWLEPWLAAQGVKLGDVAHWAIHPGGPRILTACGEACELTDEQLGPSRDVLAEFGNMSSPTVLFILERLRRQRATGPCVALAFGPGLTIEAALLA